MSNLHLRKLAFDSAVDRINYLELAKRNADIGLTAFAADIIITATITTKKGLDSIISIEDTSPNANTITIYAFDYASVDNHAINSFLMSIVTMLEFDGNFDALTDVSYTDIESICNQLENRYIP